MVLLKVACICATPSGTERRVFRTRRTGAGAPPGAAPAAPAVAEPAPPVAAGAPAPAEAFSPRGALGVSALGVSLVSFSSSAINFPDSRQLVPDCPPYLGGAIFLPATILRGPLRVRALVCVRCPRTGSPLR